MRERGEILESRGELMLPFLPRFTRPEPTPDHRLPPDVVAAIESAGIKARGEPDPVDGTQRFLVTMAGGGPFHWEGHADTAARLARRFGLTDAQSRRAAELLARHIARENRAEFQGRKTRRNSWVWGWMPEGLDR
jgi:hypothetical protein